MRFSAVCLRFVAMGLLCFSVLSAKLPQANALFTMMNMQIWLDEIIDGLKDTYSQAESSSCLNDKSKKVLKSAVKKSVKFIHKNGYAILLQTLDSHPHKDELWIALQTPIGQKFIDALASKKTSICSCTMQRFDEYERFWGDVFSLQDMLTLTEVVTTQVPEFVEACGLFYTALFTGLQNDALDSIRGDIQSCGIKFDFCH